LALIGDESYYWLWSERLAPSYFDHPAGVAVMVRLSTLALGRGEAGIRWLNASLGLASVLLSYAIGARLFSRDAGLLAAAMLGLSAPYLVISRFVYPDALQLSLLLLSLYLIVPFITEREHSPAAIPTYRFWAVGLSMAALFNTKYNVYLYGLAVGSIVLWSHPALLRDRRTWGSIGIALCGLLPALWWNAANQWAPFHWQYTHLTAGAVHRTTLLGRLWHAFNYLTPPVACLAALGAVQYRHVRQRILLVPALLLTLPVLLSPADSPRNLIAGTALLLLLGAGAVHQWTQLRPLSVAVVALCLLVGLTGVYGLGTVLETLAPSPWPHSSVATGIRRDALGWRDAQVLDLDPQASVFALDYSIAAQLRYYTGIPVQTAWGQYRMWGVSEICNLEGEGHDPVVVIGLPHVDPAAVSQRLRSVFGDVQGPSEVALGDGREAKQVYIWRARECSIDTETFLQLFDLLSLLREGSAP
jgi:4-amino-4-deoxy-L-arabinose transferase-like glycosyltransferase